MPRIIPTGQNLATFSNTVRGPARSVFQANRGVRFKTSGDDGFRLKSMGRNDVPQTFESHRTNLNTLADSLDLEDHEKSTLRRRWANLAHEHLTWRSLAASLADIPAPDPDEQARRKIFSQWRDRLIMQPAPGTAVQKQINDKDVNFYVNGNSLYEVRQRRYSTHIGNIGRTLIKRDDAHYTYIGKTKCRDDYVGTDSMASCSPVGAVMSTDDGRKIAILTHVNGIGTEKGTISEISKYESQGYNIDFIFAGVKNLYGHRRQEIALKNMSNFCVQNDYRFVPLELKVNEIWWIDVDVTGDDINITVGTDDGLAQSTQRQIDAPASSSPVHSTQANDEAGLTLETGHRNSGGTPNVPDNDPEIAVQ